MRRKYIKCTKAAVICMSVMLAFSSAYASDSTAAVETTASSEINESDNNTTDEKSNIDNTINDEMDSITTENRDSESKISDNVESADTQSENNESQEQIKTESSSETAASENEQIKSEINQNDDNKNTENAEEKTEANKTAAEENKTSENTDAACKTEKEVERPSTIVGEGVIDEEFSNTDETDVDDSNVEYADTKTNTVREISPETIILPEPTRDGYTFVEQNTRIDGEGTSYQAGDEIEVVPMSLYAIWQENELTE